MCVCFTISWGSLLLRIFLAWGRGQDDQSYLLFMWFTGLPLPPAVSLWEHHHLTSVFMCVMGMNSEIDSLSQRVGRLFSWDAALMCVSAGKGIIPTARCGLEFTTLSYGEMLVFLSFFFF